MPAVDAAKPPPSTDAPAVDRQALKRYASQLGELFASRQSYPRLAAARGWEGEVRLRLLIAATGAMLSVSVLQSSGHTVLDEHALALVRAATLPPPPGNAASTAGELQIEVPILYTLKSAS